MVPFVVSLACGGGALPAEAVAQDHPSAADTPAHIANQPAPAAPQYRPFNKLPGYNMTVSAQRMNALRSATTQIMYLFTNKGPGQQWEEWDSAVNVSLPNAHQTDELSAGHGLSFVTGYPLGAFSDIAAPENQAENFINNVSQYGLGLSLGVSSPLASAADRLAPLAGINGVSVDTAKVDAALLQTTPSISGEQTSASNTSQFAKIPSIPIQSLDTTKPLIEGEQVALVGLPTSSGDTMVSSVGRYLGTDVYSYTDTNTYTGYQQLISRMLYFVAEDPASARQDPCYYGGSGGGAITASGQLLAPLSLRFPNGYGPKHIFTSIDGAYMQTSRSELNHLEKRFNVNLTDTSVVCAYSDEPSNFVSSMEGGFNTPAPAASSSATSTVSTAIIRVAR